VPVAEVPVEEVPVMVVVYEAPVGVPGCGGGPSGSQWLSKRFCTCLNQYHHHRTNPMSI